MSSEPKPQMEFTAVLCRNCKSHHPIGVDAVLPAYLPTMRCEKYEPEGRLAGVETTRGPREYDSVEYVWHRSLFPKVIDESHPADRTCELCPSVRAVGPSQFGGQKAVPIANAGLLHNADRNETTQAIDEAGAKMEPQLAAPGTPCFDCGCRRDVHGRFDLDPFRSLEACLGCLPPEVPLESEGKHKHAFRPRFGVTPPMTHEERARLSSQAKAKPSAELHEAVEAGGARLADCLKGMTREQLEIKPTGGDETFRAITAILAHSNLQAVIDHVVGLIETLNADVAKALTDVARRPEVLESHERVRAAAEFAIKAVENSLGASIEQLREALASLRSDLVALRATKEQLPASDNDLALNQAARAVLEVGQLEKRMTDSNQMWERERATMEKDLEKLRKDFESFRMRVSNRIALEDRRGWRAEKLRQWTGSPLGSVVSVTIKTTQADGWYSHFVGDKLIMKHPAGSFHPCSYCEANVL